MSVDHGDHTEEFSSAACSASAQQKMADLLVLVADGEVAGRCWMFVLPLRHMM